MLFSHLWSVIFFKFTEFLIMLKLLRKNSHLLHAVHLNFKTILAVFDQLGSSEGGWERDEATAVPVEGVTTPKEKGFPFGLAGGG